MPTPAALTLPQPQPAAASAPSPQLPFHPAVTTWFHTRFGAPTEVQTRAWAITTQRCHALIAAPTGSGKTLAAFLSAINELVVQGLSAGGCLPDDAVQVLYVLPLKALSNDIRKNLQEPLAGIRAQLVAMGVSGLSVRQVKRLCCSVREQGAQGLVSRKRGRPSNRRISDEQRKRYVALVRATCCCATLCGFMPVISVPFSRMRPFCGG